MLKKAVRCRALHMNGNRSPHCESVPRSQKPRRCMTAEFFIRNPPRQCVREFSRNGDRHGWTHWNDWHADRCQTFPRVHTVHASEGNSAKNGLSPVFRRIALRCMDRLVLPLTNSLLASCFSRFPYLTPNRKLTYFVRLHLGQSHIQSESSNLLQPQVAGIEDETR